MDLVQIPYYSDADELPCPLPTQGEIEKAPDIVELWGRRIVAVGSHYIVKYGRNVDLAEGQNMVFIRKHTTVDVPQLYAMYPDTETGINYIIMERIHGSTLLSAWPQLTDLEKQGILGDLRHYFVVLRQLPSPDYFGSLGRRKLLHDIFWSPDPDVLINGPFATEEQLNEALVRKHRINCSSLPYRSQFLQTSFATVFKGHKPTFTHGDLQRKNIMICPQDGTGRRRVVLLDWEKSGWYPDYWEFCMAYVSFRYQDDWPVSVEVFLEPYITKAAWFQALYLELWS